MKKGLTTLILCLCLLALSGCAPDGGKEGEAPAARVVATDVPEVTGSASGLNTLLDPWRSAIGAAPEDAGTMGYLIPQEIFIQAERDYAAFGYTRMDGRLVCTVDTSSVNTYEARGMNTGLATMSPDEKLEDVSGDGDMDTTLMGDWVHSGGGTYTREADYSLAEDLKSGTVQFRTLLNGTPSAEERFAYLISGDTLIFLDATLTSTVFDEDGQSAAETWLITCGKIWRNGMNVVEYTSNEALTPDPSQLDALDPDAFLSMPQARQTAVR